MIVSIRELKSHLSHYLSQAQAGQLLEVTSHRKVVARVVGVPSADSQGVARLLVGGLAQWGGGKPLGAAIALSSGGRALSGIVMDERG